MGIINVATPSWDTCDSYGILATELAAGLEHSGYYINRFGNDAPLEQQIRVTFGGILLGYPTLYQSYPAFTQYGTRIAMTMFESTQLPDGWGENLNAMDGISVPSQFVVDVMRECGVEVPIHVHPLGISEVFTRQVVPREWTADEPLTILAIGDRGKRKGWDVALSAFVAAFGEDERYKLILKARQFPFKFKNANIEIIAEDYSDEEMAALYRRSHIMLFPTCGEGFGLPPREFAATGGIVLATNWSGTADDIKHWGIPLEYRMTDAWFGRDDWYKKLGQWAEVNVLDTATKLKAIADDFEHYANFGVQAAEYVAKRYRWQDFANSVDSLWKEVQDGSNSSRSIGIA